MSEILLEEINPNGNLQAIVESDGRVCFLYLTGPQDSDFGMRAVWVCNLVDGPPTVDRQAMLRGEAPLMPRNYCRNPNGCSVPNKDHLRFVWLPEGNGVALLESDSILAIVPPFSGVDGFSGYSTECIGQGPFAWELDADNIMHARFHNAEEYWRAWDQGDVWSKTQDSFVTTVESAFGKTTKYFAVDNDHWPPKALLYFSTDDWKVLVTIGMSLRPQPNVETYVEDPTGFRRIELAVAIPASCNQEVVDQLCKYLSTQSNLPWELYTWLGEGHTIPCDAWPQRRFCNAILTGQSPIGIDPEFESVFGDPVHALWFVPITESDREVAIRTSSQEVFQRIGRDRWKML